MPKQQASGFYFEKDVGGYNIFSQGFNENWTFEDLGGKGQDESGISDNPKQKAIFLRDFFASFNVFHFHDTSSGSSLKQPSKTLDYKYLKSDGSNLAVFFIK